MALAAAAAVAAAASSRRPDGAALPLAARRLLTGRRRRHFPRPTWLQTDRQTRLGWLDRVVLHQAGLGRRRQVEVAREEDFRRRPSASSSSCLCTCLPAFQWGSVDHRKIARRAVRERSDRTGSGNESEFKEWVLTVSRSVARRWTVDPWDRRTRPLTKGCSNAVLQKPGQSEW